MGPRGVGHSVVGGVHGESPWSPMRAVGVQQCTFDTSLHDLVGVRVDQLDRALWLRCEEAHRVETGSARRPRVDALALAATRRCPWLPYAATRANSSRSLHSQSCELRAAESEAHATRVRGRFPLSQRGTCRLYQRMSLWTWRAESFHPLAVGAQFPTKRESRSSIVS